MEHQADDFPHGAVRSGVSARAVIISSWRVSDGRYVAKAINAPKRYFVTSLVPFGYSDEVGVKPTGRYEPDKLVYNEKFGEGRKTITKFERRLGVCCH